jgi:hypothetical protein
VPQNHAQLGRTIARLAVVAGLLLCSTALCAQTPDASDIVARMQRAEREVAPQAYQSLRRYEVFRRDGEHARTEILAKVDYVPPGQKSYEIKSSTGGMGERAIRHALDHEVDLTREPEKVEINERNYDFVLLGSDDCEWVHRECYLLQATPKRSDQDLLKSKVWVDAETYRIMRVQGSPAKSPSFWIKDLDLTIDFGEVGGVWTRTVTRAEAQVRFSGAYTVLAHTISMQPDNVVAAKRAPKRHRAAVLAASAIRVR